MRFEPYLLDMPPTATTGSAFPCRHLVDKWIQVAGVAGGATFQMEGTINGTDWLSIGTAISTNSIVEIPTGLASIRINRTVAGTGTPSITLGARNARAD